MNDHEIPEAIRTATFRRINSQMATVEFDAEFSRLFRELDSLMHHVYIWARRQSQSFRWAQPLDYVRPAVAVTDPTCPGKRVPGTHLGVSTMGFIFRIDTRGHVTGEVDPLNLSKDELTQLVDSLSKLISTRKRR